MRDRRSTDDREAGGSSPQGLEATSRLPVDLGREPRAELPRAELPRTDRDRAEPGSEGGPRAAGGELPLDWRLHDFRRPRALLERELRALGVVHGTFARRLEATLSVLARTRVQAEVQGISQRPYFEFIRSLPNPTSLHVVYAYPHQAPLVLEMGLGTLLPLIERMLGGRSDGPRPAYRPLTRVEQGIAGTVARRVLDVLAAAWSQGPDVRLDVGESEHNPLLVQVVGPSDPTLVLAFELTMGIRVGTLHLAMPLEPLQSLISSLVLEASGGNRDGNSEEERDRILGRVARTGVTLSAELPAVPISLKDLLTLRPGDMIDTQIPRSSEIQIAVEGRKVFRGSIQDAAGRRVVRVTRLETDCPAD